MWRCILGNQRVRISVANLASYLSNQDTGEIVAIGIASKKLFEREGKIRWQAIGGAATMTERGMEDMRITFSAEFQGEGDDINDARFTIPLAYVDEVLRLFVTSHNEEFCEASPIREVVHELEQEGFCGEAILRPNSLVGATSIYEGAFLQEVAEDGKGTSDRSSMHHIPTRRVFFVHTLCVSNAVFVDVLASPFIVRLNENELETTQFGRTKGITRKMTPMADNLCNWIPGHITG